MPPSGLLNFIKDRFKILGVIREPDPSDASGKLYVVDIAPKKTLPKPVTLAAIKAQPAFASFPLVRMSRLSVMPVTDAEWKRIEDMST